MGDTKSKSQNGQQLTPDQVAVKQLVTVVPEPRTAEELAQRYAGLRFENQWPEQSESSVKARITELLGDGVFKEGDKAPNGEPTIELA